MSSTSTKSAGMVSRNILIAVSLVAFSRAVASHGQETERLSFLVVGDWGGLPFWPYATEGEIAVAKHMGSTAAELNSSFTLALGDNFYFYGVTDVDDPRFKETFEDVFTAASLMTRWYVIAGNHDHYGNVSAELAYTKRSNRWYFPSLYYTETRQIGTTGATVQFVFIDTVSLAGLTDPDDRDLAPGPIKDPEAAEEQWQWINATLAASQATWLFVAGHYPVWSVAEHGPTATLVQRLRPLLETHKVTAYLNGHDHDLQHIRPDNQTVDYFTTGAGAFTDSSTKHEDEVPKGSLKFRYGPLDVLLTGGGYSSIQLTPSSAVMTFYNGHGENIYSSTNNSPRI